MKSTSCSELKLYCRHFLVLVLGSLAGVAAAYGVSLLPLPYGSDLEAARKLGIVSLTILEGYSKTRDTVNYVALITLPTGCALLFWYIWAKGSAYDRLRSIYARPELLPRRRDRLTLLAIFSAIALISFNINYFFEPIFDWSFPIEEGVNLFAVASILTGGVQSLDFTTQYGPMLIYPLALLMKLIGATLLTDRIYTYLLNLVAYGIVTLFFYQTIRSRFIFVVASILYLSVFHPFVAVSPNTTYLRVALGFVPLLFIGSYLESKARSQLWLCGLVTGQSLLFSQEVGSCSLIALTTVLFVKNLPQKSFHCFMNEMLHLGGAVLASIAPLLLYFAAKGALTSFLFDLIYYPKLYSLGFGALKFPSIATLFTGQPSLQVFFPYWLIAVYLLAALWLLPQLIMGNTGSRTLIPFALLVMGLFLFRSALCRADVYHYFFVGQPVFLLFFILLDQLLWRARSISNHKLLPASIVILFAHIFSLPYLSPQYREATLRDFVRQGFDVTSKFTLQKNEQQLLLNKTGGVPIGADLIENVTRIHDFLLRNTIANEYVYFYPNHAGYYFLFNRKNPTRYGLSYEAITTDQRLEIIRDLEAKKPRFVIWSRQAWLIDNIPPDIQVPELHAYLATNYALYEDMNGVLVMKRIPIPLAMS